MSSCVFCFQGEDDMRDSSAFSGLGDVYKRRQKYNVVSYDKEIDMAMIEVQHLQKNLVKIVKELSLIHI